MINQLSHKTSYITKNMRVGDTDNRENKRSHTGEYMQEWKTEGR